MVTTCVGEGEIANIFKFRLARIITVRNGLLLKDEIQIPRRLNEADAEWDWLHLADMSRSDRIRLCSIKPQSCGIIGNL